MAKYWKPVRPASPILYLDFDGVLHHEDVYANKDGDVFLGIDTQKSGFSLFQWADILRDELAKRPPVQIILSTTWARKLGKRFCLHAVGPELAELVVGSTFEPAVDGANDDALSRFEKLNRGQQVERDAHRRGITNWIALDDDVKDWPELSVNRLVACKGSQGISETATREQLAEKLDALFLSSIEPDVEQTRGPSIARHLRALGQIPKFG